MRIYSGALAWKGTFDGRRVFLSIEYSTPAAPQNSGPKFFALANSLATNSSTVRFTLPKFFVEKANLGMNSGAITTMKARDAVSFKE